MLIDPEDQPMCVLGIKDTHEEIDALRSFARA